MISRRKIDSVVAKNNGDELRRARDDLGLTNEKIAELINSDKTNSVIVSPVTVAKFLRGERIKEAPARYICRLLKCDPNEAINYSEKQKRHAEIEEERRRDAER